MYISFAAMTKSAAPRSTRKHPSAVSNKLYFIGKAARRVIAVVHGRCLVHGDLSEFNILVDEQGPVIIDLPQAVDAAANNNAQYMLARDVNKISSYYGRYAPQLLQSQYAKEIWKLYEDGELHPEIKLTGAFAEITREADVKGVLREIELTITEEQDRKARQVEADGQT